MEGSSGAAVAVAACRGQWLAAHREEELLFQEKLFAAMEEDGDGDSMQCLDGVAAWLDGYADVYMPWWWWAGCVEDPHKMGDEAYVEWVCEGMWQCIALHCVVGAGC